MKKFLIITMMLFLTNIYIYAEDIGMEKYGYELTTNFMVNEKGIIKKQSGHGTAIGVDLSNFSYKGESLKGNKYLLTAAHCVVESTAITPIEILIKIPKLGWIIADIVVHDTSLDIAVIKLRTDLPNLVQLDTSPIVIGTPIIDVGCPEGSLPHAENGSITEPFQNSFQINVKGFYHGSSGGGVFRNEKLIGINTSGLSDKSDPLGMKRGVGIFIPIKFIKMILD